MEKSSKIIAALLTALLILPFTFGVSSADTIIVDQNNGPYYTIADGIAAASNGDTVLVMPAIYVESVTLNVEITLLGFDLFATQIWSTTDAISCRTGSGASVIKGLNIQAASEGIRIFNEGVAPIIEGNIIHDCITGIYSDRIVCIIRNNIIKYCNDGINIQHDEADAYIYNNIIHNCSLRGIFINYQSDPVTYSNIIFSNNQGFYSSNGATTGTFFYNCVWNNSNSNWGNITPGPSNISEDPLFVDLTSGNYLLQPGSPCIDTGRPGPEYFDLNGSRNDMGIFGGPYCWGAGAPLVLDVNVNPISIPQGGTINVQATGTVQ